MFILKLCEYHGDIVFTARIQCSADQFIGLGFNITVQGENFKHGCFINGIVQTVGRKHYQICAQRVQMAFLRFAIATADTLIDKISCRMIA